MRSRAHQPKGPSADSRGSSAASGGEGGGKGGGAEAKKKKKPVVCIVMGMAGSGKTTLLQRLNIYTTEMGIKSYFVNLDPAVKQVPFGASIDIRDTVNYKEVRARVYLCVVQGRSPVPSFSGVLLSIDDVDVVERPFIMLLARAMRSLTYVHMYKAFRNCCTYVCIRVCRCPSHQRNKSLKRIPDRCV